MLLFVQKFKFSVALKVACETFKATDKQSHPLGKKTDYIINRMK
jgi:hypothetical protein